MTFDESEFFSCPYCGSENLLFLDPSGGSRQKFVVDCETCCQPIVVNLRLDNGAVHELNIYKENE